MESLIKLLEKDIEQDYEMFKKSPEIWGFHFQDCKVPDRKSENFIDMCTARLVLRFGFARGMRLAFMIKEEIENG